MKVYRHIEASKFYAFQMGEGDFHENIHAIAKAVGADEFEEIGMIVAEDEGFRFEVIEEGEYGLETSEEHPPSEGTWLIYNHFRNSWTFRHEETFKKYYVENDRLLKALMSEGISSLEHLWR